MSFLNFISGFLFGAGYAAMWFIGIHGMPLMLLGCCVYLVHLRYEVLEE